MTYRKKQKKPGIFDILFSGLIDPRGTTKRLLGGEDFPPWAISTLLLFVGIVIVAPLLYKPPGFAEAPQVKQLPPVLLTTFATLIATSFFVTMGLRSLRFRKSWYSCFASLTYATAPFTSTFLILLIVNKLAMGDLTLLGFLSSGFAREGDISSRIFPYLIRAAALLALLILTHALSTITRSSKGVGALMAAAVVPLTLGSFIMGLTVTDMIFPLSSPSVISFFRAYLLFPN